MSTDSQSAALFVAMSPSAYAVAQASKLSERGLAAFYKSPAHYHWRQTHGDPPESSTRRQHAAARLLIAGGQAMFNSTYMVGGKINPKSGKPYGFDTLEHQKWCLEHGKPVITQAHYDDICQWRDAVYAHAAAVEALQLSVSDRPSHHGVVFQGEVGGFAGIARLDWYNAATATGGVTIRFCDDLDAFDFVAERERHYAGLVWNELVRLAASRGDIYRSLAPTAVSALADLMEPRLIVVERAAPYRCEVRTLSHATREQQISSIFKQLQYLETYMQTGNWVVRDGVCVV